MTTDEFLVTSELTTAPDVIASLKNARKVSTPLLAISTADQWATMAAIATSYDADTKAGSRATPIVQWDCARGFLTVNEKGKESLAAIMPKGDGYNTETPGLNLVEALVMASKLPGRSILFLLNAHLFFDIAPVIQGIMNLRELFKENQRTLVMLGTQVMLPPELQQDVMTIVEPLPTAAAIDQIILGQIEQASEASKEIVRPDAVTLRQAREALTGLAAFPCEQSVAVSLASTKRLDVPQLWERKRAFVEQIPGLSFDTSGETFDDIGGMDEAKAHGREVFGGALPPSCVIRIDEIEKHMAGATGVVADSSGTSQDQLGVILRTMEDRKWRGMIAVGPPGGGKSIYSKALAKTFGVPGLELDLNATKGSLVGQSEKNIRNVMRTLEAIGGTGVYMVATCNKLDVLPPELRRRYVHGIWYFDVPSREELAPIWRINLKAFGLDRDDLPALLDLSDGWTGAEVRNVCRLAFELRRPLEDMARRIVPVSISDPDSIERLRKLAAGKFLSAAYPGPYQLPSERASGRRKFMEQ